MRTCLLFFAILFTFCNCAGQIKKVRGVVVDEAGRGIPYVAILGDDSASVAYCDTEGRFVLEINLKLIRRVTFKGLGYRDRQYTISRLAGDSIVVMLDRIPLYMGPVKVVGKRKTERKARVLGKRKCKENGSAYMKYGDEVAIFLNTDAKRKGVLNEVFVYVPKVGNYTSEFKVNIYGRDSVNPAFPGEYLNKNDHLVQARWGNEWVRIDMSGEQIMIDGGIFVSVEWVETANNSAAMWTAELPTYYLSGNDAMHKRFNGQVLGMTWGYGMQSLTYTCSRNNRDVWSVLLLWEETRYADYSEKGNKSDDILYLQIVFCRPLFCID